MYFINVFLPATLYSYQSFT